MSFIQPQTIQAIAHSVDIPRLAGDAAAALAPDVEYRLREVVQEALKFARHSKRTKLTADDINSALRLRNAQPVCGLGTKDPAKFVRAAGHPDLFYVRDRELTFGQLIEAPLPKVPREPGVSAHWLFISGTQPAIPENMALEPPAKRAKREPGATAEGAARAADGSGKGPASTRAAAAHAPEAALRLGPLSTSAQVQAPVRHMLSKELQVYFDKVVSLVESPVEAAAQLLMSAKGGATAKAPAVTQEEQQRQQQEEREQQGQQLLKAALASLSCDPGLHPLAPYFTALVANGVAQHLDDLHRLGRLLELSRALLLNPAIHMEHYLQQLLPAVMTCLVTKSLGSHASDDHWPVRDKAAQVIALACESFGEPYHNVAPRVWRLLAKTLLDGDKSLPAKYGAVVGLQALGPRVVRTLLLPHLEPFVTGTLQPALASDAASILHYEAWRCHAALLQAVGSAMYDLLIRLVADRLPESVLLLRSEHANRFDWERLERADAAAKANGSAAAKASGHGAAKGHVKQEEGQQAAGEAASNAQAAEPTAANGKQPQQGSAAGHTAGFSAAAANGTGDAGDAGADAATAAPAAASHATGAAPMDVDNAATSQPQPAQQQQLQQRSRKGVVTKGSGGSSQGTKGASKAATADVRAILAESWKDDSDVNATLGALLTLFGESLLAYLPLAELPAFFI